MPKTFTSLKEVERTYFPNQILSRLEEALCSKLGLTKHNQHRLKTENLETGYIEVDKTHYSSIKDIAKTIRLFYKKEGYHTRIDKKLINIKERGEKYPKYWVQILEDDTSFMVWVYKSQLRLLNSN